MSSHIIRRSFAVSIHACVLSCIFIGFFGCKNTTDPGSSSTDTTKIPITHTSGEFGWVNAGVTIDRRNFWSATSYGSAAYTDFGPGNSHRLEVTLKVNTGVDEIVNEVDLILPMPVPMTGKFNLAGVADLTNASITLTVDTARYRAVPGGTLEITKFDTLNNTVSGTFSFDATHGSDRAHVTSGYFNDMPIYYCSFNQGLVTASVNGVPFTSRFAQQSPSFWSTDSAQHMVMTIDGDNNGDGTEEIAFGIQSPMAGYYYDLNGDPRLYGTYVHSGSPVVSINSLSGAVGRLTITKFDWVTHRISGTFFLEGNDSNGDYISVTNGVITDVQWFLL